jgi:FtsZ-interacting cell division protein ZipA
MKTLSIVIVVLALVIGVVFGFLSWQSKQENKQIKDNQKQTSETNLDEEDVFVETVFDKTQSEPAGEIEVNGKDVATKTQ